MQYFFKKHEANFKEWRKNYDGIPDSAIAFLKHINSSHFKPDLELWNEKQWKKVQIEAIERCVYSFEILGQKDVLTNIVTGGGKTTILNSVAGLVSPDHKIFSVEDVAEININHENWFTLVSRTGFGLSGEGEIGLYDLIKAGVRHRPDYIIVGEIRGSEA